MSTNRLIWICYFSNPRILEGGHSSTTLLHAKKFNEPHGDINTLFPYKLQCSFDIFKIKIQNHFSFLFILKTYTIYQKKLELTLHPNTMI
jgi:hypothetical protein